MRVIKPKEEEARLAFSNDLMYGNLDHNKEFAFDVRMKHKYLVYHAAIFYSEDAGQWLEKANDKHYSFYSPTQWDKLHPAGKKSWFEKYQRRVTILHDPIKMAEEEGEKIKGYHVNSSGLSLQDKLAKAKPASELAREKKSSKVVEDTTEAKSTPKSTKKESEVKGG